MSVIRASPRYEIDHFTLHSTSTFLHLSLQLHGALKIAEEYKRFNEKATEKISRLQRALEIANRGNESLMNRNEELGDQLENWEERCTSAEAASAANQQAAFVAESAKREAIAVLQSQLDLLKKEHASHRDLHLWSRSL